MSSKCFNILSGAIQSSSSVGWLTLWQGCNSCLALLNETKHLPLLCATPLSCFPQLSTNWDWLQTHDLMLRRQLSWHPSIHLHAWILLTFLQCTPSCTICLLLSHAVCALRLWAWNVTIFMLFNWPLNKLVHHFCVFVGDLQIILMPWNCTEPLQGPMQSSVDAQHFYDSDWASSMSHSFFSLRWLSKAIILKHSRSHSVHFTAFCMLASFTGQKPLHIACHFPFHRSCTWVHLETQLLQIVSQFLAIGKVEIIIPHNWMPSPCLGKCFC